MHRYKISWTNTAIRNKPKSSATYIIRLIYKSGSTSHSHKSTTDCTSILPLNFQPTWPMGMGCWQEPSWEGAGLFLFLDKQTQRNTAPFSQAVCYGFLKMCKVSFSEGISSHYQKLATELKSVKQNHQEISNLSCPFKQPALCPLKAPLNNSIHPLKSLP